MFLTVQNNVVTLTVVSCTISEISCRDELGAEVNVNRKYILSMAHACTSCILSVS